MRLSMGKLNKPTISFSVEEDQKKEITEYAIAKGLKDASTLARMALFAHMRKYPLSKIKEENCHAE